MTKEEIMEYQRKERAFAATSAGKLLHRYKGAAVTEAMTGERDYVSYKKLRDLGEATRAAWDELRAEIERLQNLESSS